MHSESQSAGQDGALTARQSLVEQVRLLPNLPGVYRYYDEQNNLLYVGKAINLKKRVSSYFMASHTGTRIGHMLTKVVRLQTTVVRSEAEALILENNLIKQLKPKYNIVFRDDKSYPYLKITRETFSRMIYYRGNVDTKHHYFGPYPNAHAVKEAIELLQKTFLLRTCEDSVFSNRTRPCLLHQIQRCSAPCVGAITQQDYLQDVEDAAKFLQGKEQEVIGLLQKRMQDHVGRLEFEKAALLRDRIEILSNLWREQASQVLEQGLRDVDVVVAVQNFGIWCVNLAMVRSGRHLGDRAYFPSHVDTDKAEEVLNAFVEQHYLHIKPAPVVVSNVSLESLNAVNDWETKGEKDGLGFDGNIAEKKQEIERKDDGSTTRTPHFFNSLGVKIHWQSQPRGQAKIWLDLALQNASLQMNQRVMQSSTAKMRTLELVKTLKIAEVDDQETDPNVVKTSQSNEKIGLKDKISLDMLRIECFDISHTAGEATMASCVVFENHLMQPNQYRRFNIKNVTNGDDYAAMREVLQKRYTGVAQELKESEAVQEKHRFRSFPHVVLIDGGRGQITVAKQVFQELGLPLDRLVGIEKGEGRKVGLEELVFADGRSKIFLGSTSLALMLLAQIRDEAHRFAITGMRNQRARNRTNTSALENIEGVGAKRRSSLLQRFGGIRGVAQASVRELASVQGISMDLAQTIYDALH